jgi:hypothetical protein
VDEGEVEQVVEVQAMSHSTSGNLQCPSCFYDLRATAATTQHDKIRCPECGSEWDLADIKRIVFPHDRVSRSVWALTTYGPAFVAPLVFMIADLGLHDDAAATLITSLMLGVYSAVHSSTTTPPQKQRWIQVSMRAVVHFFMMVILAFPASLIVVPIVLLLGSLFGGIR